jgi:hypothetical protein
MLPGYVRYNIRLSLWIIAFSVWVFNLVCAVVVYPRRLDDMSMICAMIVFWTAYVGDRILKN